MTNIFKDSRRDLREVFVKSCLNWIVKLKKN